MRLLARSSTQSAAVGPSGDMHDGGEVGRVRKYRDETGSIFDDDDDGPV